jgi:hypothetical protein
MLTDHIELPKSRHTLVSVYRATQPPDPMAWCLALYPSGSVVLRGATEAEAVAVRDELRARIAAYKLTC